MILWVLLNRVEKNNDVMKLMEEKTMDINRLIVMMVVERGGKWWWIVYIYWWYNFNCHCQTANSLWIDLNSQGDRDGACELMHRKQDHPSSSYGSFEH